MLWSRTQYALESCPKMPRKHHDIGVHSGGGSLFRLTFPSLCFTMTITYRYSVSLREDYPRLFLRWGDSLRVRDAV
jgi:hypothetical protein